MGQQRVSRKIACSDIHLKLTDPLGVPTEDGLSTRIHQKLKLMEHVVDMAIQLDCNEILDFGDLFESINPPSKIRNSYARCVKRAIDNRIRVTRITGNHETDGREPDGLDVSLLSDMYTLVTEIQHHPDYTNLLLIPEVDPTVIHQALVANPDAAVFGHFEVNGSRYSSGVESIVGLPQTLFTDRKFPTWLGHIHLKQTICNGQVDILGASLKKDFGERKHIVGITLFGITDRDGEIEDIITEFLPYEDISLHQLRICEGDAEVHNLDIRDGDIVKLVYEGSHPWFAGCSPRTLIKLMTVAGAAKVILEFNPISEYSDLSVQLTDSIDFEQLITAKAEADKQPVKLGLEYLRKYL